MFGRGASAAAPATQITRLVYRYDARQARNFICGNETVRRFQHKRDLQIGRIQLGICMNYSEAFFNNRPGVSITYG